MNISKDVRANFLKSGKKYRLLSLFSGCGGMDLGFEGGFKVHPKAFRNRKSDVSNTKDWITLPRTPFQLVFANDISKDARVLWQNYFHNKYGYNPEIYMQYSIVDLVKRHKNGEPIFPDDIDIVTGGFPCQDFSLSGKRRGFSSHRDHNGDLVQEDTASEETRGKLYMWMKEVIEITKPKIFIAENVKGLVNLSNTKDIIQKDFSSVGKDGYIVLEPRVLHAARYGVPQARERVFFIGIKRSALREEAVIKLTQENIPVMYDPYPQPTHSVDFEEENLLEILSVGEVLSSLKEPEETDDLSQQVYSKAKFMGRHCQGQNEINLAKLSPTIRSEHHGNIEFRRLSESNGGRYYEELSIGLRERRLTPRECALIQTFPYDYEFVMRHPLQANRYLVSPSAAYKAIGNAVPPLLAYHIANRLDEIWSLYFN